MEKGKVLHSSNCFPMNGIFENSRGLRDLAKHARIADFIRHHRLDFVGISETGKSDFSVSLVNRLSSGVDFTWKSRSPRGRFRGILLGVRTENMDVLASSKGEFHIKFHIRNKADNFIWSLVAMYGATQDEHKSALLRELVNLVKKNPCPIISIYLGSHMRRIEAGLTTDGLSYLTMALTVLI